MPAAPGNVVKDVVVDTAAAADAVAPPATDPVPAVSASGAAEEKESCTANKADGEAAEKPETAPSVVVSAAAAPTEKENESQVAAGEATCSSTTKDVEMEQPPVSEAGDGAASAPVKPAPAGEVENARATVKAGETEDAAAEPLAGEVGGTEKGSEAAGPSITTTTPEEPAEAEVVPADAEGSVSNIAGAKKPEGVDSAATEGGEEMARGKETEASTATAVAGEKEAVDEEKDTTQTEGETPSENGKNPATAEPANTPSPKKPRTLQHTSPAAVVEADGDKAEAVLAANGEGDENASPVKEGTNAVVPDSEKPSEQTPAEAAPVVTVGSSSASSS